MQREAPLPKSIVRRRCGLSVAVLLTLSACSTLLGCPSELPALLPQGLPALLPQRLYELFDVTLSGSVESTPDGGLLLVGRGSHQYVANVQLYASRLSPSGDVIWARIFDGLYPEGRPGPSGIGVATPDGGCVVAASTGKNELSGHLQIVRTDASGETVWGFVHEKERLLPQGMVRADDGGYVVVGADCNEPYGSLVFLLKVTEEGTPLWLRSFERMLVNDMKRTPDGGLVVVGSSWAPENPEQHDMEMALLRTDPEGNGLWFKRYHEEGAETAFAVDVSLDGGFVLAGRRISHGVRGPCVLTTDQDGNLLWRREDILEVGAGEEYEVWDMLVDPSGNIVLVVEGTKVSYIADFFPVTAEKGLLFQLDGSGNVIWEAELTSGFLGGVCMTPRGTYMTVGSVETLQLIEVDTNGNILN